ncbi:hypothetical protein [Patiriisocius marinus]|uniref:Uncharacterized protein n=1 Tax=Patiriisocius marinus TaxID=1397112 RepID=A0A5J4IZE2_9FLAO|nr:hypothetical protein [Patiriisocius marinus]GER59160.1 hypothetical protein ULMA_12680 [Patiriisocius marinus]
MKYRNVGVKAGHKLFIREKTTAFDKQAIPSGSFQEFTDHKKMKTWEYAAFQKEQFKQIRKRKRTFYILLTVSIAASFIFLILGGLLYNWFGNYGNVNY